MTDVRYARTSGSTMVNKRRAGYLLALLALAACSKAPDSGNVAVTRAPNVAVPAPAAHAAPVAAAHGEAGIAWRKGDVDAAFAAARAENKPVFMYWGATWCPPCNQVKATIFKRQDFIDRSGFFVPVYIDGDSPSAQKEGARFKVSGYPTMILFTPDGREITRLPGEVDADQYMRVLAMGMSDTASPRNSVFSMKISVTVGLNTWPTVRV